MTLITRCLLEVKAFYEILLNVKSVVGPRYLHLDDSGSTKDRKSPCSPIGTGTPLGNSIQKNSSLIGPGVPPYGSSS